MTLQDYTTEEDFEVIIDKHWDIGSGWENL